MVIALDVDGQPVSIASGFFFSPEVTFTEDQLTPAAPRPSSEQGGAPPKATVKTKSDISAPVVASTVVTKLHALKWASSVLIKPYGAEARLPVVDVLAYDLVHDLCVLEVTPQIVGSLQPATVAVRVGDPVYVIGNPKGLEGTFSSGIIAAVRSEGEIQIDAPISPGSSGGPVLNSAGGVLGVATSSVVGGQNLNFAVPAKFLMGMHFNDGLPVAAVGALAITDREYAHFKGPVRTSTETVTEMQYNRSIDELVPGPEITRLAQAFGANGRIAKYEYFKDGAPNGQTLCEYGDDGLRVKLIHVDAAGHREEHNDRNSTIAAAIMASAHNYGTIWDEGITVHEYGWNEKGKVHKYDPRGNEVELEIPAKSERWITTFDSDDREVETKVFRSGKLSASYRYAYETDAYGNWTKKQESIWMADFAQSGYRLAAVYRRRITYF